MTPIPPDIAAELGFPPDQGFDRVDTLTSDVETVDRGALDVVALTLAALVEGAITRQPDFAPMAAPPALVAEARCEIQQWRHEPGIFLVRADKEEVRFRGVDEARMYRFPSGELFVDARDRPFYLRVGLADADQVWTMTRRHVLVDVPHDATVARSPSAEALKRWSPHAAATVTVPTVDEVFAGLARPDWMVAEVTSRLATATPWEVTAAWGMVARLGQPAAKLSLAGLLDAAPPEAPALAWLARNPAAASDLVAHVVHEGDRLVDALSPLALALVDEEAGARGEALAWLHRRDDLESVAFVLTRAGVEVDVLRRAVAAVDREAGLRQEMWAFTEGLDDARLGSVSWQEPGAWWASALRAR